MQHDTFHAACRAHGLLEDDGEWRECLHEAAEMQTGYVLRRLFATLLLFCSPSDPATLWHDYCQQICIDLCHQLQGQIGPHITEEEIYDYGLYLIDKLLQESGKSLAVDWPTMPHSLHNWGDHVFNPLIAEHLSYNQQTEGRKAAENIRLLNHDQLAAFTRIMDSISNKRGNLYFLNGPGGTGKTFVYKTICHQMRANGWIVLVVASSGIAALLMEGGCTAHSMFKIPVHNLNSTSFCHIPKEGQLASLLRHTHAIMWDEIGMQHRHGLEAVDRTLQDILGNPEPFGGITVVFGGDYQQILPVIRKGKKEEVVDATLQRSSLWQHIEILHLTHNMRLSQSQADKNYAKWLTDVGHGHGLSEKGTIKFPQDMRCDTADDLINFVYPGLNHTSPLPSPDYFLERMILAPRNVDVTEINAAVLQQMPGGDRTYYSSDKVIRERGVDGDFLAEQPIPVEVLRAITGSGIPPGELNVKLGCPLILLRNLAPSQGLCNGTRMVVVQMTERILQVLIIGGDHHGETAFIPRITLNPPESDSSLDHAFSFSRRQFPVRLAFALSINKAQGQSAKYVGLDLRVPVFAHGQLYVALSRATSRSRIRILINSAEESDVAHNVVYPEVLL